jgi:hypothetical protein
MISRVWQTNNSLSHGKATTLFSAFNLSRIIYQGFGQASIFKSFFSPIDIRFPSWIANRFQRRFKIDFPDAVNP